MILVLLYIFENTILQIEPDPTSINMDVRVCSIFVMTIVYNPHHFFYRFWRTKMIFAETFITSNFAILARSSQSIYTPSSSWKVMENSLCSFKLHLKTWYIDIHILILGTVPHSWNTTEHFSWDNSIMIVTPFAQRLSYLIKNIAYIYITELLTSKTYQPAWSDDWNLYK